MRLFKLAFIVGLGIVFGVAIYLSQSLFGGSSNQKLAANTVSERDLPAHDAVVLENLHKAIPVSRHSQKETKNHFDGEHAASQGEFGSMTPSPHYSHEEPHGASVSTVASSAPEEDASMQIRPDAPVTSTGAVANPPSSAPSAVPSGGGNPHVQFAMTDTNSSTPRTKTIVDR